MDEYISREDVLKKAKSSISVPADNEWDCGYNTAMAEMQEFIKHLTAVDVQPVDRWISVDERLPKTGESVLVYVAINKNLKGFGECKPEIRIGWIDDGGKWALQFSNMDYSEVLCWLPLPELPKDGDTNG